MLVRVDMCTATGLWRDSEGVTYGVLKLLPQPNAGGLNTQEG